MSLGAAVLACFISVLAGYIVGHFFSWKLGVIDGYAATRYPHDKAFHRARKAINRMRASDGLVSLEDDAMLAERSN